ncbi:hypothetical protein EMIT0P201_12197 [Pseudomonas chlororaphis]
MASLEPRCARPALCNGVFSVGCRHVRHLRQVAVHASDFKGKEDGRLRATLELTKL